MSNYLLAALIAFLLCVALLFLLLPLLKRKKAGQEILEYVKEHSYKSGTPTMGGIAIILAMLTAALIFGKGKFVYITLAVAFAYGVTGFLDDSIKIHYKRNLGLRPYQKIILQLSIALIVAFVVYKNELIRGDVYKKYGVAGLGSHSARGFYFYRNHKQRQSYRRFGRACCVDYIGLYGGNCRNNCHCGCRRG